MIVKCPTCKKSVEYKESNFFRPFCSERCQTLDLGAWADEQYKIPVRDQEMGPVNENPDGDQAAEIQLPPKHHLN